MRGTIVNKLCVPIVVLTAAASAAPASAQSRAQSTTQTQTAFDFTIPNIMRGPEIYGRAPENPQWTADGRWIYFEWLEPGSDYRESLKPFRVRATPGAAPERVTAAHMDSIGPSLGTGVRLPDGKHEVLSCGGDIYERDVAAHTTRPLTQTLARESAPRYSADGNSILYVSDGNAFALDRATGLHRQLTDIRTGTAPADSAAPTGQRGRLMEQQRELFEVVRDRVRADSVRDAEREAARALNLATYYVGARQRLSGVSISPNMHSVLVMTTPTGASSRTAEVPLWVTESGYVESVRTFPLAGSAESTERLAFISLPRGELTWIQPFGTDSVKGRMSGPEWNQAGTRAVFVAYSEDNKQKLLQSVSGADGSITTLDAVRDSAWVGGPCGGCFGWYDHGRRVWFVSEHDGFAHLYTVAADGTDRRQLTNGDWEVLSVELSPDGKSFLLRTNEVSPADEHMYRMSVDGGSREQLTTKPGRHLWTVSPDGQWAADVYSFVNRPPELYLRRTTRGAEATRVTTSPTDAWLSFPWIEPALIDIPASDGVQVPAHIYRPADMGAQPNGAAVIFVHGAGYLHNVGNFWSEYPREYMFNQYLAAHGYVVLDVDYRGSSGYGRDWRTAIYRHMGGRDLQDQVDASTYLQKNFGIDPERVGIYGGSYGGFITLMALFTEPEHFGAGAALRSVTDWSHYNHGYTTNILNLPQDDTLAYRQSSPIYFAEGLEDPLLMLHGMVDTNVPFQDIVRLTQRLIELGKTDWDLAVYPVESHGFVRPSSWTDEYRRIFELFERTISGDATTRRGARE
jgi:dipeptidyl aminopeptidase/acylaminoacyl peptidase